MARACVLTALALAALGIAGCDRGRREPERSPLTKVQKPEALLVSLDPLKPGLRHRRHLPAGLLHRYAFSLQEDQYLHLAVEQLGLDLVAEVRAPSGRLLLRVDGPSGSKGTEDLFLAAGSSGRHFLEISAFAGTGDYEIRVEALRAAGEKDRERAAAAGVFSQARLLERRDEDEAAAASYQEAARLWSKVGEASREAWALYWLGKLYNGHPARRREAFGILIRSLGLFRSIQDERQQAVILSDLGNMKAEEGDYEKAGLYQERALALWQKLGGLAEQAARLNDLATVRVRQGRMHAAIDLYTRSSEVFRRRGEWSKVATIRTNLGLLYDFLGESRMALDHYRHALALLDRQPDSGQRGVVLTKLGDVLLGLDGPAPALELYRQALDLRRRNHDKRGEAVTLNSIGLAWLEADRPEEALQSFRTAVEIFQREGDVQNLAVSRSNLGLALERLGHPDQARGHYEKALEEARGLRSEEMALFGLARVARMEGKLEESERWIEQTLTAVEAARNQVGRPDLQATYQAARQEQYGFLIDLLAERHRREPERGHEGRAFAVSERARARSLLDLLAFAGNSLETAELRQLDELSQRINARHLDLIAASARARASDRGTDGELMALLESFRQVKAGPPESRPPLPGAPSLPSLARVQSTVLDRKTLLLEYFLGKERSFLWAVTSTDVRFVTNLPGRAQIEAAARRTYEGMTESHLQTGEAAARQAAARLSRMILAPVADLLGRHRLVIVASGALRLVSFAALPHPDAASRPLIEDHEIVSLPSVAVLAALRSELAGRRSPRGLLAMVADPVLGPEDERLRSTARAALNDHRTLPLRRLANTGGEAGAIVALAGSAHVLDASSFEASRSLVRSGRLGGYRILHFATHGLANDLYPELSSLALSAFDASGRPVDGQLRAYEVSDLDLRADLVVLSACRTARGEDANGEGLGSLTQGFLHAGAARLVVSLWDVSDRATAELMNYFYTSLLHENLPPAQALRKAQLALRQQNRWRAPYYWAGFVLQGEWN